MKKSRDINFAGFGLLMLYAFSIVCALLFHHHEHDVVVLAYTGSSSCQMNVHEGYSDTHHEHIGMAHDKCWFCDHHTIADHLLFPTQITLPRVSFFTDSWVDFVPYRYTALVSVANKGSPTMA